MTKDDENEDNKEILLKNNCEIADIINNYENLNNIFSNQKSDLRTSNQSNKIKELNPNSKFINSYYNPHNYWELCFPYLFPYGRGGPSDPIKYLYNKNNKYDSNLKSNKQKFLDNNFNDLNNIVNKTIDYNKHMIQIGGFTDGRRFQQEPSFIFNIFMYVMNKNINGLTYISNKNNKNTLTIEELKHMKDFVKDINNPEKMNENLKNFNYNNINKKDNNNNDINLLNEINECEKFDKELKEKKIYISKLINQLKPYSNCLPGTPLFMENEKKSFYSMIDFQVILNNQTFRFVGF